MLLNKVLPSTWNNNPSRFQTVRLAAGWLNTRYRSPFSGIGPIDKVWAGPVYYFFIQKSHSLLFLVFLPPDMSGFREVFSKAKHIAIITGAGVSAESGVPTFRGENEKWRKWQSQVISFKKAKQSCAWGYHFTFLCLFKCRSALCVLVSQPAAVRRCCRGVGVSNVYIILLHSSVDLSRQRREKRRLLRNRVSRRGPQHDLENPK